jgi:hypothetical protein
VIETYIRATDGLTYIVRVPDGVKQALSERAKWLVWLPIGAFFVSGYVFWPFIVKHTYFIPDELLFLLLGGLPVAAIIFGDNFRHRVHYLLLQRAWAQARRTGRWLQADYTYSEEKDCKLHD